MKQLPVTAYPYPILDCLNYKNTLNYPLIKCNVIFIPFHLIPSAIILRTNDGDDDDDNDDKDFFWSPLLCRI